jgi:hypothetical protein
MNLAARRDTVAGAGCEAMPDNRRPRARLRRAGIRH